MLLTLSGWDFIQPQTQVNKLSAVHNTGTDSGTSSHAHLYLVPNNEMRR